MVSYTYTFSTIFCAIAIVAPLLIHSSYGVSTEDLTTICSKVTPDPDNCVKILQADPRTASANLPELSLISIELTRSQANYNLKVFRELRLNATRAQAKKEFDACVGIYEDIQLNLKAAYSLSLQRKYRDSSRLVQAKESELSCRLSINSLAINELRTSLVLKLYTSISVNRYIASLSD